MAGECMRLRGEPCEASDAGLVTARAGLQDCTQHSVLSGPLFKGAPPLAVQ